MAASQSGFSFMKKRFARRGSGKKDFSPCRKLFKTEGFERASRNRRASPNVARAARRATKAVFVLPVAPREKMFSKHFFARVNRERTLKIYSPADSKTGVLSAG